MWIRQFRNQHKVLRFCYDSPGAKNFREPQETGPGLIGLFAPTPQWPPPPTPSSNSSLQAWRLSSEFCFVTDRSQLLTTYEVLCAADILNSPWQSSYHRNVVTLMGLVCFNDQNASNITYTKGSSKIRINYSLFSFFSFRQQKWCLDSLTT